MTTTQQLRSHLTDLRVERALASTVGLDRDAAYMNDLEQEFEAARQAYVGAAVTEIASLRSALGGAQWG